MMEQNLVLAGKKIELAEIPRTFEIPAEPQVYHGQFLEWCRKDELKITMSPEKEWGNLIEPGKLYLICLYTVKGLFQCKAAIRDCETQGEQFVVQLQIQSGLEKYQRRHFYRMVCALNCTYQIIKEEAEQTKEELFSGVILDLSGGGFRFNTDRTMEPGTQILLQMHTNLPKLTEQPWLKARILSAVPLAHKKGLIEHRAEFVGIHTEEREAVIQYIFLKERKRKMKQKGSNIDSELCQRCSAETV